MFRLVVIAALSVALAACGLGIKRPVAAEDLPKIQRVGVVSLVGNTFHGISVGTTIFNNEYFSASVPEWDIERLSTEKALAYLRRSNRLQSAAFDRSGMSIERLTPGDNNQLWDAARRQGFDTLVIIYPRVSDNARFFRPGFGLFERSLLGWSKRCIYAAYTLEVYEVASGNALAWDWSGGSSVPCTPGSDDDIPFLAKFDDYSPERKDAIRQRVETRISEPLAVSFANLSLVQ